MELKNRIEKIDKQIETLENELKSSKKELEVLELINGLKTFEDGPRAGYNTVISSLNISREGMNDFIELLHDNEYIKTYRSETTSLGNSHSKTNNSEIYYLSLGKGLLYELKLVENEYLGYTELNDFNLKRVTVKCMGYIYLGNITMYIGSTEERYTVMRLLDDENRQVFGITEVKDSYIENLNDRKINETISSISISDLINRYLKKYTKEANHKNTNKLKKTEQ